jgi:hypothetical protein
MRFLPFRRSGRHLLRYNLVRRTDCATVKSTRPALIRRNTFALGLATPPVGAPLVRAAEGLAL